MTKIEIREATPEDFEAIWPFFQKILQTGGMYVYAPDTPKEKACRIWFDLDAPSKKASQFVAMLAEKIVGSFAIRRNFPDLGSHVANASLIVDPEYANRGIGKVIYAAILENAKAQGYTAIQLNQVVSTNTWAVHLPQSFGFEIIGISPKAYQHPTLGLVDTYIMHRFL